MSRVGGDTLIRVSPSPGPKSWCEGQEPGVEERAQRALRDYSRGFLNFPIQAS